MKKKHSIDCVEKLSKSDLDRILKAVNKKYSNLNLKTKGKDKICYGFKNCLECLKNNKNIEFSGNIMIVSDYIDCHADGPGVDYGCDLIPDKYDSKGKIKNLSISDHNRILKAVTKKYPITQVKQNNKLMSIKELEYRVCSGLMKCKECIEHKKVEFSKDKMIVHTHLDCHADHPDYQYGCGIPGPEEYELEKE